MPEERFSGAVVPVDSAAFIRGSKPPSPSAFPAKQKFAGPIWMLILIAPFVAEVLSGSTRFSFIVVYLPEVMVWGVGALLCRELVRRWRGGATSLLLLGLALSVAEEFIIQQTSIAPLPFPGANAAYGRMWGVNWAYFLFMLGFESVWVVVVPVQLTELAFPSRRDRPWLRTRSIVVCCVVFVLGSFMAWFGWTQQARPRLGAAAYHPPAALLTVGIAAILALIGLAYILRGFGRASQDDSSGIAPAWLAGGVAFAMGAAWSEVVGQEFVPKPIQPFWIVLVAGIAWAVLALVLFTAWSSRRAWSSVHRWAASCGATLGCMTAPYLSIANWAKPDLIALIVFDVVALAGFALLGWKVVSAHRAREVNLG